MMPETLRPDIHLPGTFRIKLSGNKAAQVQPDFLAAILLEKGLIASLEVWQTGVYYRLQHPLDRYGHLEGSHDLKHGLQIDGSLDPLDPSSEGRITV